MFPELSGQAVCHLETPGDMDTTILDTLLATEHDNCDGHRPGLATPWTEIQINICSRLGEMMY